LVAGLAILSLCLTTRRWRWLSSLHPLTGLLLAAAMVLPWFILVANKIGPSLYLRTIFDETLGRSLLPKEGHWAPPGYHLVLLPVLFWPGSLLTAAGVVYAFRQAFRRGTTSRLRALRNGISSPDLFLLAWIIPSWLVFELASTKLPHYTMPLYPAVAVLSARAVVSAGTRAWQSITRKIARIGFIAWFVIGCVLVLGGSVLSVLYWGALAEDQGLARGVVTFAGAALLMVFAVVCFGAAGILLLIGDMARSSRCAILAWAAGGALVLMTLCPALAPGAGTPHLARAILDEPNWPSRPIGSEFHEDSLVYALRGHVERIDEGTARDWLAAHPDGIAIVHDRFRVTPHWWTDSTRYEVLGSTGIGGFDVVPNYYAVKQLPLPKEPMF
jgi:4-amino-4-deoxy-L-arabinose transferase-like glycosyltransferase